MISAYFTAAVVLAMAISYVGVIHCLWLRHVFRKLSEAEGWERRVEASNAGSLVSPELNKKRIVILGGGFAGVKCAQTLSRALPHNDAEIVLFNGENHFVFTPL